MPWACLWLFVYVTMAIGYCNCVLLWEYLAYFWFLAWNTCHKWRFTNWHHTNRVCKFGFPDMMVETWSSSVSSYFCGSAAYNRVGWNIFWGNIFLLMYLRFHKLSWRLKTCLVIIQMPNKFLIAPREGIWTCGDTGQCAALNRVWSTLELCSLLYIWLLFYLKRWTTPL